MFHAPPCGPACALPWRGRRAAVLARQRAEDALAALYRERAAQRDPNAALN